MKKIFFQAALFLCIFCGRMFSYELSENFSQFVLQNGMNVFIYEDFSSPTVRVEYTAKAGFSSQEPDSAGFAPLYSELFLEAGLFSAGREKPWLPLEMQAECNADSARYYGEFLPDELQSLFEQLGACAFAPVFQDDALKEKLSAVKEGVRENAFSIEGFINGAIDSRVFSAAPWKHDSGIYPALFEEETLSSSRVILQEFGRRFYSPQNSALFICGAVKKEAALFLAEKTFGVFPPSAQSLESGTGFLRKEISFAEAENPGHRKFVLSDPELSADMAQAVVQWKDLDMEEADIAAFILNQRNSALKKSLTQEAALAILGSDYINADAAHKNAGDRLIVQTLMEKSDASFFEQALLLERLLKNDALDFGTEEFESAKRFLIEDFEASIATSRGFMDLLSQFWAVDGLKKSALTGSGQAGDEKSLVQRFLSRPQKINGAQKEEILFRLKNEEPYIFILLNSKAFSKVKKSFSEAGYQSVTAKNASWYSQELFAKIRDSVLKEKSGAALLEPEDGDDFLSGNVFLKENENGIFSAALKNGLPVTVLKQKEGKSACVALYIKGGRLSDYADGKKKISGLEAVTVSALSDNIHKAALKRYAEKKLGAFPSVTHSTGDTSSLVTVECAPSDAAAVIECIGEALIFSDTNPAALDPFIASLKSGQSIKSGTLQGQLYSAAARNFYRDSEIKALYSDSEKFLEGLKYADVLENYISLLDAGRLELVACGAFDTDAFILKADELLGNLNSGYTEKSVSLNPRLPSKNSQRVRLTHKFLTDISGDKAGPRPAVLIPTTDFSDPVQYWILCPDATPKDRAVFDALLFDLAAECRKIIESNERSGKMHCRIEEASPLISFGVITFFNVGHTSDADAVLQEALENVRGRAGDTAFLREIKSGWIKERYKNTWQPKNACALMAENLDFMRLSDSKEEPDSFRKNIFIKNYRSVWLSDKDDFLEQIEKYFSGKVYRFYSADGKK